MASTVHGLICANCQGRATLACKNCLLVTYCGSECQRSHWAVHKQDCKSPMTRDNWKPAWIVEDRKPFFMSSIQPFKSFGKKKYLWGNVPALDILKLDANEGVGNTADLRLLFAASGDLRNVVKTISSVSENSTTNFSITINDRDLDIVARNAILLLVAFVAESSELAAECMVHTWYSAMLSQDHMALLQGPVRDLIEETCAKIGDKGSDDTLRAKTWRFGSSSLRLVLTKRQWVSLLEYLTVPASIASANAQQIRKDVTMAHERRDYRDRALFKRPPMHRICEKRFREDGMLLPFGQSRELYNLPNPTLFQSEEWPMKDSADPLDGWAYTDILKAQYGPATNDIYGRLFTYTTMLFSGFYRRLRSCHIDFQLFNLDAQQLHTHVQDGSFARVEVSNISDNWCLGAARTVRSLGRFLQHPAVNPHATLLTLFMNAVEEAREPGDKRRDLAEETAKVSQYLPSTAIPRSPYDPTFLMRDAARDLVTDNDKYFKRYTEKFCFDDYEHRLGFCVKSPHTIIDQWPMRLKKRPGEQGAKEEFKLLVASGNTGNERYVEWKRTR